MYGVGGLDDVTFVGDGHRLEFLWVEVHSQSDSHLSRASISSWRAFESCWLVMGWYMTVSSATRFTVKLF